MPLSVSCKVCGRGADGAVILFLEHVPAPEVTDFNPDWTSPPGDTMADIMAERGLDAADVANQLGLSGPEFDELLLGAELTDALAAKLPDVLGCTEQFWRTREQQYRDGLSRHRK